MRTLRVAQRLGIIRFAQVPLTSILSVCILAGSALRADPVVGDLLQRFDRIEAWAQDKTFIWKASMDVRIDFAKPVHRRGVYPFSIVRQPGQVFVRTRLLWEGDASQRNDYGLDLFYSGNTAMQFEKRAPSETEEVRYPSTVYVWECPGECWRYVNMFYIPLLDAPAFAFLAGANPLKMYDCSWRIHKVDDRTITLICSQPRQLRETCLLVFDKRSGNLLKYEGYESGYSKPIITWEVSGYIKVGQGIEIPRRVSVIIYSDDPDQPEAASKIRKCKFEFVSYKRSEQMDFSIPKGKYLEDYRLISDKLSVYETRPFDKAVLYQWEGALPDKQQLRLMALKQGKLAPEPSRFRFAWWLVAPGVLLVVRSPSSTTGV
jgi:hypothetical protein